MTTKNNNTNNNNNNPVGGEKGSHEGGKLKEEPVMTSIDNMVDHLFDLFYNYIISSIL